LFLPFFESITCYIGAHFFKEKPLEYFLINSDTLGLYIHLVVLFVLSITITVFFTLISKTKFKENIAFYEWFKIVISYYLSLQLLIYGFDKIFKHQFYLPEPNTLYTPLGFLSKDILYWSSMGSSYSYSLITGVLEVVAAVFLLFKPTRVLGAIFSIAIMANVVVVNFSFDVSVKIYSVFLLLLSITIAFSFLKKIGLYFILNKPIKPEFRKPNTNSILIKRSMLALKSIIIIVCVFEALYVHIATNNYNDDLAIRPLLHGAYNVKYYIKNGDTITPVLNSSQFVKRIYIHKQGYFITQFMNEEMQDYPLTVTKSNLLLFNPNGTSTSINYTVNNIDSSFILKAKINNDSIIYFTKKIDLKKLPLLHPCFHWTADEF
jgi:hypothetical protein